MTDSIYLCAISLCCCLVICAVLRMIMPNGNTSRILSVVISVFVLCCLFSPLINIVKKSRFSFNEKHINVNEEKFIYAQDDRVINKTAGYINQYVNNLLLSKGVNNASVKTILALNEDRGIYIKELNIYLDKEYINKAEEINKLIVEYIGTSPVISENKYE